MKQFFKFLFASILGTLLALFIAFFGMFFIFAIIASTISSDEVVSISENTVLEIQLNYSVPERSSYRPSDGFAPIFPEIIREVGMNEILRSIRQAKYDSDISGIYLNLNNLFIGSYTKIAAIRKALSDFKTSGKFIYAHGNRISQRAYYLASVADSIYITPTGSLDLRGMALELTFFKKTVDKLEIEPQIFQAGKYKSAVEQFENEKMSKSNREQLDELLQSIYHEVISEIASDRNIDASDLRTYIDDYNAIDNQQNYSFGLIDGIKYFDQVIDMMKEEVGKESTSRLRKVKLIDYINVPSNSDDYSRNRIAVIYAIGEILENNGNENTIGIENIANELRKARRNTNVKAVVLRIESPGGSPLTSEIIRREVELTREVKPVIASFASVAASGGYYIATHATEIITEPFCITGSIGAYGIVPNFENFFDNKLGITFDRVQTSKYAAMFSLARPLTADEKKFCTAQG
jgi:protease-4